MKRYQPATHRTLGVAAAALMTVATLAIAVIAPAAPDKRFDDVAQSVRTTATSDDTCVTTRVDVIAVRVPHARRAVDPGAARADS